LFISSRLRGKLQRKIPKDKFQIPKGRFQIPKGNFKGQIPNSQRQIRNNSIPKKAVVSGPL
jgi:hypothetical protein